MPACDPLPATACEHLLLGVGEDGLEVPAEQGEDAQVWGTAGWGVVAGNGEHIKELGVCGDLHICNSLEFHFNDDWREQLASPRPAHASSPSARTASASSASACSAASAAATQASGAPLAGPGFQFARNADGRITIGAIAPGGPANAEGSLAAGDELVAVDGLECERASARDVRAAILGVQGSTVRLKVYRTVERRYFDVALVRGSTEGWSLSDKLKDMECRVKEKDSVIDLLRIQLTSALEREARAMEVGMSAGMSAGMGAQGGDMAKGRAPLLAALPSASAKERETNYSGKVAEAALDTFLSFMNPIQTNSEGASPSVSPADTEGRAHGLTLKVHHGCPTARPASGARTACREILQPRT